MRIQRVIFVDEHDTCRAPMAAAQLRACPMKRPVEILSRGLVVLFPGPLNQKAQAVLIGNGLSVEKFSSTPFDLSELTEQTLVLTMDRRLREKVLKKTGDQFPERLVWVLNEYVGEELEIMDPYGATLPAYGVLFESLNVTIRKLAEKINQEVI